jgi:hypothetical protein
LHPKYLLADVIIDDKGRSESLPVRYRIYHHSGCRYDQRMWNACFIRLHERAHFSGLSGFSSGGAPLIANKSQSASVGMFLPPHMFGSLKNRQTAF